MKNVDVFLGTGVSVEIPDGVDSSTDEGYLEVKALARTKFLTVLNGNGFDIEIENEQGDSLGPS